MAETKPSVNVPDHQNESPSPLPAALIPAPLPKAKRPKKSMGAEAMKSKPKAKAVKLNNSATEKKSAKKDKPKKIKMVRDSFTMPEQEYVQLAALKKKCLKAGVAVKKSELLRAGLAHLTQLADAALLRSVAQVEKIKTGRPAKHR